MIKEFVAKKKKKVGRKSALGGVSDSYSKFCGACGIRQLFKIYNLL